MCRKEVFMKFVQIIVRDDYMYGLDKVGDVWVCKINGFGQQWTEWKPFTIQKVDA
jgi:hypothetical protein